MASGVGAGDAVITVAHTFIATVEAISQSGAETEFIDIDERTYNMSPEALAQYLEGCRTIRARAVHSAVERESRSRRLFRFTSTARRLDMNRITGSRIATACSWSRMRVRHTARSIKWALQTAAGVGPGRSGRPRPSAFIPAKNLGACGEAGAVTTDDEQVARSQMLRDHGQVKKYYHDLEGYNGRLDAIQAAFLRVKLRRFDAWNASAVRRLSLQRLVVRYKRWWQSAILTPFEPGSTRAVYHLYVIRVPARHALAEHLTAKGIHTGYHYPVPVHFQSCYRHWGYQSGSLPVTERVASEIVSLPMFPGLTAEQQQRVAAETFSFVTTDAASSPA